MHKQTEAVVLCGSCDVFIQQRKGHTNPHRRVDSHQLHPRKRRWRWRRCVKLEWEARAVAVAASTLAPYDSSPMRRHVCSPAALGGGCASLRVSAPSDVYVRDEDPSGGAHKCSGSGDFEGRTALPVLECVQQPGDIVYVPINWVSVCGTRVDNGIQLALPSSFNFVHARAKSRGLSEWWADRNTPVATLTL